MPLPPSHPSSQAALGKLRLPSPILDPDTPVFLLSWVTKRSRYPVCSTSGFTEKKERMVISSGASVRQNLGPQV